MKNLIHMLLAYFDIRITRKSYFDKLNADSIFAHDINLLKAINPDLRNQYLQYLDCSKSQIRQDLFVLSELNFKRNGFFVEFGATNGVDLSNTHLLEREFDWKGILAEPARVWQKQLRESRTAIVEPKCVWIKSGESLPFNETANGDLSTIERFSDDDKFKRYRKGGARYKVDTISLVDLLEKHQAPSLIDYLSIDTEGSEYEILKEFNFDKYQFSVITCEHNNTSRRQKIYELLTKNGYRRKFEHLSNFEDWYVLNRK